MNIRDIVEQADLENSLLIGFYGGGNYGDELLLEILQRKCQIRGVRQLSFSYHRPELYHALHHDFGYNMINTGSKVQLIKSIFKARSIILGGGGFWGRDVNKNTLIMSLLLFVARRMLRKRVYLLGVGYYNSTNALGKISAVLAAWGSTIIIGRDQETYANFRKCTRNVYKDKDIAFTIDEADLTPYAEEAGHIAKEVGIADGSSYLLIGFRRFHEAEKQNYLESVRQLLTRKTDKKIILATFEPKDIDPEGFETATQLHRDHPQNTLIMEGKYNPLATFSFFHIHRKQLSVIAPQFHVIATAALSNIPAMPLAYDNKVKELLHQLGAGEIISFYSVNATDMDTFLMKYNEAS